MNSDILRIPIKTQIRSKDSVFFFFFGAVGRTGKCQEGGEGPQSSSPPCDKFHTLLGEIGRGFIFPGRPRAAAEHREINSVRSKCESGTFPPRPPAPARGDNEGKTQAGPRDTAHPERSTTAEQNLSQGETGSPTRSNPTPGTVTGRWRINVCVTGWRRGTRGTTQDQDSPPPPGGPRWD